MGSGAAESCSLDAIAPGDSRSRMAFGQQLDPDPAGRPRQVVEHTAGKAAIHPRRDPEVGAFLGMEHHWSRPRPLAESGQGRFEAIPGGSDSLEFVVAQVVGHREAADGVRFERHLGAFESAQRIGGAGRVR